MTIEVRDGVTAVDGVPRVLVTADYPYYRDRPEVWADRLRAVRDDLGIEVITSYLPWRHHQPDPDVPPDFTDVIRFLALCHELGLKVIAKPGPFIHAETDYGGLPDWVSSFEPVLDSAGEPLCWGGRPLPAPLGAAFSDRAAQWLGAVGKEVLEAATYPDGPVIMMQIANEGLYTNGALPLTSYDYSPSGLAFFRARLREWYGTPETYNRAHGTAFTTLDEVAPEGADWGRFHAEYLAEVYRRWSQAVGCRVPVIVNLNPPTVAHLDDWLARVRPATWDGIHYGFTNWMGVVSADPDAHARYVIAAKLAPGPNLEENWGFSELYDRAYADATTSFHQTLLAMAAGATGFNVYTGVSTSSWSDALDAAHAPPYPDCAPIAADGTATEKAPVVKALAAFFARHGAEFLECAPVTGGAFGLYPPYAGTGGCGAALRSYHDRMLAAGLDYALLDLQHVTAERLAAHATLTVPAGPAMEQRVQELLSGYVAGGGRLVVEGGAQEPLPEPAIRVVRGRADAYLRVHPSREIGYVTVLAHSDNDEPIEVELGDATLEVVTCRGGAALIRLVEGKLDDHLVKGRNAFLGSAVRAAVSLGGRRSETDEPADLFRV
ncbi:beta-galactosidase [Nonomuraea dietziae]|uniref:Beta-galactosidase n=1 Tax=Nonomuraea dietziae TaxID=65515 RepID=A0A7W5V377_9ACTN|nr:beta-galactosidase [Nonomuraea dietziae]MBB3726971.1 beta-galactosidase [Nonomuraea dietziae]